VRAAEKQGVSFHVGNVFSGDLFYSPDTGMFDVMKKFNILGVEMEAAGIYGVAAELGAEALAICTVSNELPSGAELTAEERQTTFDDMIEIALETAVMSP
jgi:purine-nucleoside phosphorylase